MLGTVCASNVWGQCSYADLPRINPNIATPKPPPTSLWTIAPANEQQANDVVTAIANQQMLDQQAIDASGVKYVADWVPSWLVPNPKSDAGATDTSSIPWMLYLIGGIAIVGVVMGSGGRRYR